MSKALLNKTDISQMIPHSGCMCLLDAVTHWDQEHIVCESHSHQDVNNPLRRDNELAAVCGIEYAAQAMAVHAGLAGSTEQQEKRIGYLAQVKDIHLNTNRLDTQTAALTVEAKRLMADEKSFMYQFSVSGDQQILVSGRAMVVLGDALS